MGKRKLHDESYYKKKIRKLEKKLRKVSSSSRSPSHSASSQVAPAHTLTTPPDVTPEHEPGQSSPAQVLLPLTPQACDALDCGPSTSGSNLQQTPINTDEDEIPQEYILALGEEGAEKEEAGDPLQTELALRWTRLLQNGLGKDAKGAIIKKYPTPSNFAQSLAPKMNPEMKSIMSDLMLKRDATIINRQNLTGKLLCCLGKSLTKILKGHINSKELIEEINDGAKMASEIFYQDSSSRKFFVLAGVNKNIRESIKNSKSDDFLFGSDCAENIKSAQTLKKTGDLIKNDTQAPKKQNPIIRKQGNWKGPLQQQQQQQHHVRSGPRQQLQQQHPAKTHQRGRKQPAKTRPRHRY